jgi:hypothetical protein
MKRPRVESVNGESPSSHRQRASASSRDEILARHGAAIAKARQTLQRTAESRARREWKAQAAAHAHEGEMRAGIDDLLRQGRERASTRRTVAPTIPSRPQGM